MAITPSRQTEPYLASIWGVGAQPLLLRNSVATSELPTFSRIFSSNFMRSAAYFIGLLAEALKVCLISLHFTMPASSMKATAPLV